MYHRIVVAFIKQTINIQRKENERLESCLPLWAAGKILFCFVVFTTDMISLYHVLSIIKGRLYLFYSRRPRGVDNPSVIQSDTTDGKSPLSSRNCYLLS